MQNLSLLSVVVFASWTVFAAPYAAFKLQRIIPHKKAIESVCGLRIQHFINCRGILEVDAEGFEVGFAAIDFFVFG